MSENVYQIDFNKPESVHFIGIGGISMSGLAEILMDEGFTVSGSDAHRSELTDNLEARGAKVYIGQKAENIQDGIDVVVYTAARLGFAIATIVQPEILIVDEVLAVGDAAFQEKCQERMHHMLENGTTLLFVSHTMATVRQLCDHAIWLNKGDVVMQGEAESVCDAYMESLNLPENA